VKKLERRALPRRAIGYLDMIMPAAFQAEYEGSIPFTRFNLFFDHSFSPAF
jgi:hypothetical protein